MSEQQPIETPRFRRPPVVQGPDRSAAALYRMVGTDTGIAGVPLDSAEAAAIAAVRAGYRVAEAQIDRLRKVGDRARRVGEQLAGDEAEAQAVDQAERLLSKLMLAALSWLEGVAAEPGSPWHRFLIAQYRLIGGTLGLEAAPPPQPAPPERAAATRRAPPRRAVLAVVHKGEVRRRVIVRGFGLDHEAGAAEINGLLFFHATDLDAEPIAAVLRPGSGAPGLHLQLRKCSPPGVWNAAVCDRDDRQVGWIEIEI